jgi:hypothetical protein
VLADALESILDAALRPLGAVMAEGASYRKPALEVLRFYHRPVRLHWLPFLGKALSVVVLVRDPPDLPFSAGGCRQCLERVAMAVNSRYPPWGRPGGLAVGLTTLVLTPAPIGPEDDGILQAALGRLPRQRAMPLGFLRLNLGQEAFAAALAPGPGNLFGEPMALANALGPHLRCYVPPMKL